MADDNRTADEKFKEFKARYVGDLHERIEFFENTLSSMSVAPLHGTQFNELQHFAHSLAGTGGVFGFF